MSERYDVILSGPITGVPDYVLRFAVAQVSAAREYGAALGRRPNIWNPAMLPKDRDNVWRLRQSVEAVFASPDAVIVMLDGWRDDKEARAEHALAVCLGLVVRDVCEKL